jgi:hypothetical protein
MCEDSNKNAELESIIAEFPPQFHGQLGLEQITVMVPQTGPGASLGAQIVEILRKAQTDQDLGLEGDA